MSTCLVLFPFSLIVSFESKVSKSRLKIIPDTFDIALLSLKLLLCTLHTTASAEASILLL